ncbi:hypothetical protein [Brevibacterium sp.]|uniref:hypothetical protein n=1 Tax=Brevibacterium sp. TaxID=1701 RepID=UPI002812836A|nr:hypothetical protein [Brevibacterium sp.]
MDIVIRPATEFDDVAVLVGQKKPTSNVCFWRHGTTDRLLARSAHAVRRLRA